MKTLGLRYAMWMECRPNLYNRLCFLYKREMPTTKRPNSLKIRTETGLGPSIQGGGHPHMNSYQS